MSQGRKGESWQKDDQGCLYHSLAYSLPLRRKPKRKTGSHLFFQISLTGDGMEAIDNHEPLIHIGLVTVPEMKEALAQQLYNDFPELYRGVSKSKYETAMCWGASVGMAGTPLSGNSASSWWLTRSCILQWILK